VRKFIKYYTYIYLIYVIKVIKSTPLMNELRDPSQDALASLQRSWALFALASASYLAAVYTVLRLEWQAAAASRWLGLTSLTILYLLVVLGRNLDKNSRPGEDRLLPDLGWGNWMTLLRGVLVANLVGFLFSPRPQGWLAWLPGILYSLAITADALDGYLARRTNHATRLGGILDISFDGLGVLAAALLIIQYGRVPPWYVLVAFARYAFLAGIKVRRWRGKPVYELPGSVHRRIFAGIQFIFIAVVLYPVFLPPLTWAAATLFALPFLAGFVRDWLVVSGAWHPTSIDPLEGRNWPAVRVALRLGLAILAILALEQMLEAGLQPAWPGVILPFLQFAAAVLVLFGIAARINAGIALGLLGLGQMIFAPTGVQYLQVIGYTTIVYLGAGPWSLWSPEETWLRIPFGQPRNAKAQAVNYETIPQAN
jgi:CDP-diacylglycerol---glycerol-3-phosphate 3-phosphatidyltransferase